MVYLAFLHSQLFALTLSATGHKAKGTGFGSTDNSERMLPRDFKEGLLVQEIAAGSFLSNEF